MIFYKERKPFEIWIRGFSLMFELDVKIIAAIILQESSGNPRAYRYEPKFFDRYLKGKTREQLAGSREQVSLESELLFRSTSFGLMQIMGQTAKEFEFNLPLPALFEPEQNIKLGCQILSDYIKRCGSLELGITAYNRGVNGAQKYGVSPYYFEVIDKKTRAGELLSI